MERERKRERDERGVDNVWMKREREMDKWMDEWRER